jgi:methyl-accepting chemotaxis protein
MNQWTISKRITIGGLAILVMLAIVATVTCVNLNSIKRETDQITHERVPNLAYAGLINANQCDGFLHSVLFMHATTTELRDKYFLRSQVVVTNSNDAVAHYEKNLSEAKDKEVYARFVDARKEFSVTRLKYEELMKAGSTNEALAHFDSVMLPKFYAYLKSGADMRDHNRSETEAISESIDRRIASTLWIIMTVSILAVVGGILIGWSIITKTNRVLNSVVVELETSSHHLLETAQLVSANSQSLAEGASQQAASLEETSSSLEEMSSTASQSAEGAQRARDLLEAARTAGDSGVSDMQEMSQAMAEIKSASDSIAKIIKTIDEVAFQTNILALNAAVEAARAGESGMGFAVVADEVRNLAQRCAHAARETAGKIEDSINKSQRGVQINDKVAKNIQDIVEKVRSATEIASHAASTSKEQSQGIGQINSAVAQMDKTTQTTAATAEESASAAEELTAQADSLKQTVGQLTVLIGGHRQPSHSGKQPQSTRTAPAAKGSARGKELAAQNTQDW